MIFTPQCLVSRCNLAKIDPINIKSKQLYSPHFRINYMYSLVKNTKYSFRKQNRNRLRVHVLLTSCSPGRNREKHGDSREIKTKTSFTQVGRILLQIAVLFARVHRNFCTVLALEWLFEWVLRVALNQSCYTPDCDNSEFTRHDGRKRRTAKCVCVTNVTGLLLVCVVVIFTKFQCF